MDSEEIYHIEEVLGFPHTTNCPPGMEWFQNPRNVSKLRCIANVVSYIDSEFGIESPEERTMIIQFLTDLHSAFGHRTKAGENIDQIELPSESVKDYADEIGSRIPGDVFVEGMRKQFKKG